MTYIKKYGLRLLYTILSLLISILFLTTLYHYNLINQTTYNILKIIIILTNIFISSFILGQKTKIKGYLEGIKLYLEYPETVETFGQILEEYEIAYENRKKIIEHLYKEIKTIKKLKV